MSILAGPKAHVLGYFVDNGPKITWLFAERGRNRHRS